MVLTLQNEMWFVYCVMTRQHIFTFMHKLSPSCIVPITMNPCIRLLLIVNQWCIKFTC